MNHKHVMVIFSSDYLGKKKKKKKKNLRETHLTERNFNDISKGLAKLVQGINNIGLTLNNSLELFLQIV